MVYGAPGGRHRDRVVRAGPTEAARTGTTTSKTQDPPEIRLNSTPGRYPTMDGGYGGGEVYHHGKKTSWLTKPPFVTGLDSQEQAVSLWVVLKENEYQRIITRAHHRWREN